MHPTEGRACARNVSERTERASFLRAEYRLTVVNYGVQVSDWLTTTIARRLKRATFSTRDILWRFPSLLHPSLECISILHSDWKVRKNPRRGFPPFLPYRDLKDNNASNAMVSQSHRGVYWQLRTHGHGVSLSLYERRCVIDITEHWLTFTRWLMMRQTYVKKKSADQSNYITPEILFLGDSFLLLAYIKIKL